MLLVPLAMMSLGETFPNTYLSSMLLFCGAFGKLSQPAQDSPGAGKGRESSHGRASPSNSLIPGLKPPSNNVTPTFFDNLVSWRREFEPL